MAEIEVLFWIVLLALVLVVAAIVALIRSGRAVPPPANGQRPRRSAGDGRER